MSANTLTGLIPVLYQALDIISRELVGFIPAVTRNSSAARAAVGQQITYPIVPAMSAADITPSATTTDASGVTVGTDSLTISKSRKVEFPWTGEEQMSLRNSAGVHLDGGSNMETILRDQFAQAMRTLVNEVETDIAALYVNSSRAYGTAGTAPFGTANDLSDFAGVRRILDDNGAPQSDLHLVINTAAMANVRGKQAVLFKVNEAGTADLLRRGILGEVQGLMIHNSAQVKNHTKGTGASYQTNGAQALGATTIAVDTGTGTIIPGDVLSIANGTPADSNKYVNKTALSGGNVVINKPGLLSSHVDNDGVTVGNNYAANMAFHRSAIHLVTRAPAMPIGPDGKPMDVADDVMEIVDPVTGLAFQVVLYRQVRQLKYEVCLAWGVKAVKSEHMCLLLG
ncbi:MAG TPA: P22 phage major capsid protein family protein [Blastocatellia bacterium]|nr:P22 phage major capsid protein family protein [Blastocatellia bacterium]